jgi:hypothetical protein
MSSISSTSSSAGEALVSLLRSGPIADKAPSETSSSERSSLSRTPVDTVDLSDRARAILARAKIEKAAAEKLAAQLPSAGADSKTNWGATSGGFAGLSDYLQKLVNDHRKPDGTVGNFVETVNNVFNAPPSTPQEISDWYKNEEAGAAQVAADEPDPALKAKAQAYLQAVRNRDVTIVSAKDHS